MLIVEENSVYEIDEECLKHRRVPKECGVYEKIQQAKDSGKENRKKPVSGKP
ncbi:MAG: hypothetical protein ACI4AD_07850 [Roseburia sp.]